MGATNFWGCCERRFVAQAGLPGSVGGLSSYLPGSVGGLSTYLPWGFLPSPFLPALTPSCFGHLGPLASPAKSTGSEIKSGFESCNPEQVTLPLWASGSLSPNWRNLVIKELKSECLMVVTLMLLSAHSVQDVLCVSSVNPQNYPRSSALLSLPRFYRQGG